MNHEVVERTDQVLIGFEIRTSSDDAHEIGEHWGRFMIGGVADEIPGRADDTIVAAYCDYESDHTGPYTFFLGCPVRAGTEVPPGMVERRLPAGRYAHFVAEGPQPEALLQTWEQATKTPLKRAFVADFEVHRAADPDRVEIFVGL